MKNGILFMLSTIMIVFGAGSVFSQTMGSGMHKGMQSNVQQQRGGSGYIPGGTNMPYQYMMGDCPMGYGMMGGYGMGGGMMNHFGGGHMGYGMMGGYGMGNTMPFYGADEETKKFLDDTRELRKKMHDLRFDYMEKSRYPETTIGDLQKMQKEMDQLQRQIMEKAPR